MRRKVAIASLIFFCSLCSSCNCSLNHESTENETPMIYDAYFENQTNQWVSSLFFSRSLRLDRIEDKENSHYPNAVSGIMETTYQFQPSNEIKTEKSVQFYIPILHALDDDIYENEITVYANQTEIQPFQTVHHPYFSYGDLFYIPSYETFLNYPTFSFPFHDEDRISYVSIKNTLKKKINVEFTLQNYQWEQGFIWLENGKMEAKNGFSSPYISLSLKKSEEVHIAFFGDIELIANDKKESVSIKKEVKTFNEFLLEKENQFQVDKEVIKKGFYNALIYRNQGQYYVTDQEVQSYFKKYHFSTLYYQVALEVNQPLVIEIHRRVYSTRATYTDYKAVEWEWERFRISPFEKKVNASYNLTHVELQGEVKKEYKIDDEMMWNSYQSTQENHYEIEGSGLVLRLKNDTKYQFRLPILFLIILILTLFVLLLTYVFKNKKRKEKKK